jgi:proline iminopeptidase
MKDHPSDLHSAYLPVGDGHELYVESVGDGMPVVFLHGGPGSGCRPKQRRLFDPARYRTVFFDQRGAGRSRPYRELAANTTDYLIADIEAIRTAQGIDRWLVVGGSWGATLAVAYAERHPDRVAGVVLRAVFLGTHAELEWAFLDGPKRFRPALLSDFLSILTPDERRDPLAAYWKRILDPDPAVHARTHWLWHDTERILSETAPAATRVELDREWPSPLPATPLFEAHYFSNNCFLKPDQLITDASRLEDIPGIMVQGRYDLLCPPSSSAALAAAWPRSRVVTVERAGHAMTEPGIQDALVTALDDVAEAARF